MGNATAQVHFTIVDDELAVSVPPELEPLNDFFEAEVGTSDTTVDLIEHHVRHDRGWQFTGNACQLTLDGETVTVTHTYTGACTSLSRTDFRAILAHLGAVLAESYG